jgi:hypothetical protein
MRNPLITEIVYSSWTDRFCRIDRGVLRDALAAWAAGRGPRATGMYSCVRQRHPQRGAREAERFSAVRVLACWWRCLTQSSRQPLAEGLEFFRSDVVCHRPGFPVDVFGVGMAMLELVEGAFGNMQRNHVVVEAVREEDRRIAGHHFIRQRKVGGKRDDAAAQMGLRQPSLQCDGAALREAGNHEMLASNAVGCLFCKPGVHIVDALENAGAIRRCIEVEAIEVVPRTHRNAVV